MNRAVVNLFDGWRGLFDLKGASAERQYLADAAINLVFDRPKKWCHVIIGPTVWLVEKL